ncbi:MAG: XrtA system polysaccharide deacetylase [Planctomycetota bacterium]|jgi:polysaccharide deacetylase family protein (PEP-CTERM system associated)
MDIVRHALTVDVEDWFHVENLRGPVPPDQWDSMESRLERNMDTLLALLDRHGVKATFFVLGRAVEHRPGIVRSIVAGGHELACHGWSHDLIYRQTPELFAEETRRSKQMLEAQGGVEVVGYRASTFSIVERSLWALDILAREGFSYDSSIAPLRHDRYGIPSAPVDPHVRELEGGASIHEIPVCTMGVMGRRFPLGGGFFRLFPLSWTSRALREYEARGQGGMIYVHPWEIDPDQPRVKGLKLTNKLRHYARLGSTLPKLERLLAEHAWGPLRERLGAPAA